MPTPTALAPASNISTASTPDCTPPVPITGTSGKRTRDVVHRAQRDRLDRGTGEPAASTAEDRPAGLGVDEQAQNGVHEREAGRAGFDGRPRDQREIRHVR